MASFCVIGGVVEEWRGVTDSVGTYGVSDQGEVRSKRYRNGQPASGWRLLKQTLDGDGRPKVCLRLGGKSTYLVAHLVADAFLPPKGPTDQALRHLNDDPTDNRVANLAWGTRKDNSQDAIHNGTQVRGIMHGRAKLTEDNVREIRRMYATGNFSQKEIGLRFGVHQRTVFMLVRRKTWKHVL